MRSLTLRLAAALLLAPAASFGQEEAGREGAEPPAPARRIDEYGRLGHCDWTARLDNFAIELMNDPTVRGYIVSYNPSDRHSYASWQLKTSRYYLTGSRGIDSLRLVVVEGGVREDLKEGLTELWVVPEGAEPPVAVPAADRYAPGFSGKYDTFMTDPNVYEEVYEMSTAPSAVSRAEFADKLKQQPDSVGYVVIRAPKNSPPGVWRYYARREERLLAALGAEASRVRTLDGGRGEGREVELDLWVLPDWAPPPPTPSETLEARLTSAVRLHALDLNMGTDEAQEGWMLENLADFLRENPRATALLVAREPTPFDQIEYRTDTNEEDAGAAAEAAPAEVAVAQAPAEVEAEESSDDPEEKELTMKETAEEWKRELLGKYGIEARRVFVVEGARVRWGAGRLNLWVVPEKGKWPDTQARDEDEAEQEELHGVRPPPDERAARDSRPR
jgi:hypothetical protein